MEEIDELLQLVEGSSKDVQQIDTTALLYRLNTSKTALLRPLDTAVSLFYKEFQVYQQHLLAHNRVVEVCRHPLQLPAKQCRAASQH